jgi:hypothetical protein
VHISGSVAFLPIFQFWERFAFPKLSEGSNALRRATLEKLDYSAERLRVSGKIIEYLAEAQQLLRN